MADTICFTAYTAKNVMLWRVNSLGRPVFGDDSLLVAKFVTITATPNLNENETEAVTNSDGSTCVPAQTTTSLNNYTLDFEFCKVDPCMASFFNPNWRTIYDILGTSVGWAESSAISTDGGFGAAIFLNASTDSVVTEPGAEGLWFVLLFPWLANGMIGSDGMEIGSENISFTFTASTRLGNAYGRGPFNFQRDASGAPVPLLVPIDPQEHVAKFLSTVVPPEAVCGCQPLEQPDFALTTSYDSTDTTGMTVLLDAVGVYVARVDWGDGTPTEVVSVWPASHQYQTAGDYTITGTDTEDAARTATASVTVPTTETQLAAPTDLTATPLATSVSLSWTAGDADATGYRVSHSADGGTTWVNDTQTAGTGASVTGLQPATEYQFRVVAYAAGFLDSDPATVTSTTSSATGEQLAAPADLAVPTVSTTGASLNWSDVTNATGYNVSVTDSGSTVVYTNAPTASADAVTGLDGGQTYTASVTALDSTGQYTESDPATIAIKTKLAAPTNLAASNPTAASVDLVWDVVAGADTYTMSYSDDSGSTWTDYATTTSTASGTVDGLTASTSYEFRVTASDSGGDYPDSDPSGTVTESTTAS